MKRTWSRFVGGANESAKKVIVGVLGLVWIASVSAGCGTSSKSSTGGTGGVTTAGSGGSLGSGGMAPAPCTPGMSMAYYDGPSGTQNVGTCKGGTKTCPPDGSGFVITQAEVLPTIESCGNPKDVNCDGQPAPECSPSTQHPRLWITPADLPRLQSWATASNPIFKDGIQKALAIADKIYSVGNEYNAAPYNGPFFMANGQPNPSWPDTGGSGVGAPYAEPYAEFYAFMALVDPANATTYAQKARNLLMYVMNAVANCPAGVPQGGPYAPFCDPQMPTFNRSNYVGEAWGLTVDWLQAADPTGAIFTAADRATTRKVFMTWAQAVVDNTFVSPDLNFPLLDAYKGNNQRQLRNAGNNYYSGNTRIMTLMALSIDAADDPPLDGNQANAMVKGNTLRSYIPSYILPVRLYQQYAMYEDPAKVMADYGITPTASMDKLGLASGGLPVEGFLYGHSLSYVMETLLALHSAGWDGLVQAGKPVPQANLISSTYWDLFTDGFLESILLSPMQPKAPYAYLPTVFQMASYGDLLYEYVTDYDFMPIFSTLAMSYKMGNNTSQAEKALWVLTNVMPGGPANLPALVADAFTNSGSTTAILAFLALDPAVALTSHVDPRPSLPTTFASKPIARVIGRTDWTADASMFTYLCGWASINHQYGNCGQFELYRKGEWLIKERSGYDNGVGGKPAYGYTPDYHNVMGIQNNTAKLTYDSLATDLKAIYERGGQWNNDLGIADPVAVTSAGGSYVYAQDVATGLYNMVVIKSNPETNSALDVTHASRSIVWVKPDHVVVYDRAETKSSGLFKRFNLVLVQKVDGKSDPVPPTKSGSLVTGTTPNGQNIFVRAVLPSTATMTTNLVEEFNPLALLEPTELGPVVNSNASASGYHLRIEDTSNPSVARFLTVIQGADAGATADQAVAVASTGTVFDGTIVMRKSGGNVLALFLRDIATPLPASWTATCALSAEIPTGNSYVGDLSPSTTYYVSLTSSQLVVSTDATSGGTATMTDSGGLLKF